MNKERQTFFERWVFQARRDLSAAAALHANGSDEWAIFLAHQAAERALKAFLYLKGERAIVGHSIRSLVHKCAHFASSFEVIHDAGKLDELYVGPRFPDTFAAEIPADGARPEDAGDAVELARMTVELVDKLAREEG